MNAERNLELNPYVTSIERAGQCADSYIESYASSISQNILMCDDQDELNTMLREEVVRLAFTFKVMCHYLEESERHQEVEIQDCLEEFLAEINQPD